MDDDQMGTGEDAFLDDYGTESECDDGHMDYEDVYGYDEYEDYE